MRSGRRASATTSSRWPSWWWGCGAAAVSRRSWSGGAARGAGDRVAAGRSADGVQLARDRSPHGRPRRRWRATWRMPCCGSSPTARCSSLAGDNDTYPVWFAAAGAGGAARRHAGDRSRCLVPDGTATNCDDATICWHARSRPNGADWPRRCSPSARQRRACGRPLAVAVSVVPGDRAAISPAPWMAPVGHVVPRGARRLDDARSALHRLVRRRARGRGRARASAQERERAGRREIRQPLRCTGCWSVRRRDCGVAPSRETVLTIYLNRSVTTDKLACYAFSGAGRTTT